MVNVALFANEAKPRPMLASNRLELQNGTKVRVFGTLDVYAVRSPQPEDFDLDPRFTLGDITASRDRVRNALTVEGLLRRNAEHSIPTMPLQSRL